MMRRGEPTVERFSLAQRVEHFVLLLSFNILALTGLPQKYAATDWARRLIAMFGGIETTRLIHRTLAVILMAQGLYHLVAVVAGRKRPVRRHDMHFSLAGELTPVRQFLSVVAAESPQKLTVLLDRGEIA